jgi:hypothetical protein
MQLWAVASDWHVRRAAARYVQQPARAATTCIAHVHSYIKYMKLCLLMSSPLLLLVSSPLLLAGQAAVFSMPCLEASLHSYASGDLLSYGILHL